MDTYIIRSALTRTKAALERGTLTIGYLGGSITEGRTKRNWSRYFNAWICSEYPEVKIISENAAMGATNSILGCLRAEKRILDRQCDLVFVEYAVNDKDLDKELRFEAREGLLRKLLNEGNCDVVLVYTYCWDMKSSIDKNQMPETIADFEKLAEHYGISSVWPGLEAYRGWQKGLYAYKEWLPDGLHPECFGSNIYMNCVKKFFTEALDSRKEKKSYPRPLYEKNWENAYLFPIDNLKVTGSGMFYRSYHFIPINPVFITQAVGTTLSFEFEGTGCLVTSMVDKDSFGYRYKVDDGESIEVQHTKSTWMDEAGGHFYVQTVAHHLEYGTHRVEITSIPSNAKEGTGSVLEIPFIGILV